MITAANIAPHCPVYFMALMMFSRPTPTGAMESLEVKIRAIKNSFHTDIKLKMVTVTMAGCTRGSMIFRKVLGALHPSR